MLSGDRVDPDDASCTIFGELAAVSSHEFTVSTSHTRLPRPNRQGLYRMDQGPNLATYQRIDIMLDSLQRCGGVSKSQQKKDK